MFLISRYENLFKNLKLMKNNHSHKANNFNYKIHNISNLLKIIIHLDQLYYSILIVLSLNP